jgi:hypothetical protein
MKGTIEFEWWREKSKEEPFSPEHEEGLKEAAEERIFSMIPQGYTAGELLCALPTDSGDVGYKGWWTYSASI